MSGNSIGLSFVVTSFGESHGPAIGCVIDGCPPNLQISTEEIQKELDRRKPGTSRFVTQRKESDEVEILSGVFDGRTTGTPIGLLIKNTDARSKDYENIKDKFRPGHADFAYQKKYGIRDYKGGGRSSARETAVRVAAGAIAKKWLKENFNIRIKGCLDQLGKHKIRFEDWKFTEENPFFAPTSKGLEPIESYMDELRRAGDSCGAKLSFVVEGIPVGFGEPVFDRLDAEIAHALMGINAVKGVEIGAGFDSVSQLGSEHSDEIFPDGFGSNNAGGVLGGISSGQDLVVRIAIKPTSSIRKNRNTVDKDGRSTEISTTGRHDPCVGIRATPIGEAMIAIVLMDHALRDRGQNKR